MECIKKEDPFSKLFFDVHGLILQHFTSRELLQLNEVSKLWNEILPENSKVIEKICAYLTYRNSTCDLESIKLSRRKYKNICVDFTIFNQETVKKIIETRQRNWRNLDFFDGDCDETFFETFSETVYCLSLNKINITNNVTREKSLKFSKLYKLKLFSCHEEIFKMFKKCSNLMHFEYSHNFNCENLKPLNQILMSNRKLEKLHLVEVPLHKLLPPRVISQIKFHLTELFIITKMNEEDQRILDEFLTLQQLTLKSVNIKPYITPQILNTCLKMKRIKQLTLTEVDGDTKEDLVVSYSLMRLDISFEKYYTSLNRIFAATPNLRTIKISNVNESVFQDLIKNCKEIEEMYVENFDVSILPQGNYFPNIRKFKVWNVNESLVDHLVNKTNRNIFEDLIVKNI